MLIVKSEQLNLALRADRRYRAKHGQIKYCRPHALDSSHRATC